MTADSEDAARCGFDDEALSARVDVVEAGMDFDGVPPSFSEKVWGVWSC